MYGWGHILPILNSLVEQDIIEAVMITHVKHLLFNVLSYTGKNITIKFYFHERTIRGRVVSESNVPESSIVSRGKHVPLGMNSLVDCRQGSPSAEVVGPFKCRFNVLLVDVGHQGC